MFAVGIHKSWICAEEEEENVEAFIIRDENEWADASTPLKQLPFNRQKKI